ncbi:MAG: hypothetical protein MRERV_61c009 [Mycoplasmataceae bacterium RV_VA103A]|nr:MAG: hypothetical protein MRERV_61c009 [Mycoplasmataceae bacterium RV_VA103A]
MLSSSSLAIFIDLYFLSLLQASFLQFFGKCSKPASRLVLVINNTANFSRFCNGFKLPSKGQLLIFNCSRLLAGLRKFKLMNLLLLHWISTNFLQSRSSRLINSLFEQFSRSRLTNPFSLSTPFSSFSLIFNSFSSSLLG